MSEEAKTLYESLMEPISMVEDNLFIGNRRAALELQILNLCGINSIVQIQTDEVPPFHPGQFTYHLVDAGDNDELNIREFIPEALQFIYQQQQAGKKVFVHCDAGVSRSGSVVVAYTMGAKGMRYEEALAYVKTKRPCVGPNEGFEAQLKRLEVAEIRGWMEA